MKLARQVCKPEAGPMGKTPRNLWPSKLDFDLSCYRILPKKYRYGKVMVQRSPTMKINSLYLFFISSYLLWFLSQAYEWLSCLHHMCICVFFYVSSYFNSINLRNASNKRWSAKRYVIAFILLSRLSLAMFSCRLQKHRVFLPNQGHKFSHPQKLHLELAI